MLNSSFNFIEPVEMNLASIYCIQESLNIADRSYCVIFPDNESHDPFKKKDQTGGSSTDLLTKKNTFGGLRYVGK